MSGTLSAHAIAYSQWLSLSTEQREALGPMRDVLIDAWERAAEGEAAFAEIERLKADAYDNTTYEAHLERAIKTAESQIEKQSAEIDRLRALPEMCEPLRMMAELKILKSELIERTRQRDIWMQRTTERIAEIGALEATVIRLDRIIAGESDKPARKSRARKSV